MKRLPAVCFALLSVLFLNPLFGADWRGFRGPGGRGASADTGLPTTWSSTQNVVWKTKLPGAGTSSPIVLEDRVYLTAYSGYGVDADEPGNMNDLTRHVLCIDRNTGRMLWKKDFKAVTPETRYQGRIRDHGYASSTPATDGERLYVFFGKSGVYCLDLSGRQLWHTSVGERTAGWGSANSPVLYKDLVFINASIESQTLYALDKKTGKVVWKYDGIRSCWTTPTLVDVAGGKQELVLSTPGRRRTPGKIIGLDPDTGKELWTCDGIPDGYVCPSPIAHKGVVYVIGGRKNTAVAVRAGGRGDVTNTHRLWSVSFGSNVSSPVYHEGRLYWVHEKRGIAYCLDAKTGKLVFQSRMRPNPGTVYSSVTLADGKLYCLSKNRGTFVLAAGPTYKLLAHNVFEDDNSRANAIPVVSNSQLLLRSDRYLYCIGNDAAGK